MGAAVGTGDGKKNVNVDLNVVPFIDLMSCLTAFLLVTAVWSNLAQINIKPKGIGRDAEQELDDEPPPKASILVTENDIWVGISRINDFRQIKKDPTGDYDWEALREVLTEHKGSVYFHDKKEIEVGAEDAVEYQTIINTMDYAIAVGFLDVGIADPSSLSAKPQL